MIPLIALFTWVALEYAAAKRQIIEEKRENLTERVTASIDQEATSVLRLLESVARSESLSDGDFQNFNMQSAILLAHPQIDRAWAFTRDGMVVADSSDAANKPEQIPPQLQTKILSGAFAISSVMGDGRNAYAILGVPFSSNGQITHGIVAKINVGYFSQLFRQAGMEPQWAAAVVDRNGQFVSRSLDSSYQVGRIARPELVDAARKPEPRGTFDNVTYEGVHSLNSYQRSSLTGWTTVVAVPFDVMTAPLRQTIPLLVVGGTTILAATLLLATYLARKIAQPVRNLKDYAHALAGGMPVEIRTQHIAELEEVRVALEKAISQNARLSALVASSGDAIISIDLDGTIRSWNKGAEELFGYREDEISGQPKTVIVPEHRSSEFGDLRRQILSGESVRVETQRRHKDGTIIDVSLNSAPIRRPDGTIFAISSIIHDIRDRKAAEEHAALLMREIAHRSKNQLAIIQCIANQTAKHTSSKEEFVDAFEQRLCGFAASHDLLTHWNWIDVPLDQLVRGQLEVFVQWPSPQVDADGPSVKLDAASAQALGLALHELATNSTKYGALSIGSGHIKISWSRKSNGQSEPLLDVAWLETGGPEVVTPTRRGFGSFVIEQMASASLSGEARIDYRPQGIVWRISFPYPGVGQHQSTKAETV
ncbi:sensor histidine kinase [Candidatus Filomicrobium marinum]|uniref:sensor histidine kinase n=1 Tax=Candidatus Filomicrobium marinum TaxID=1608628 RepID=UPI0012601E63|nr:PAS domain S-box protein [Candidatus Filomicrobium marinum]